MGSLVFGVKIILQDKDAPVTQDTAIGLVNVASSNSEFRWLQNTVSGVSDWYSGMIVEKGLSAFSVEIDLRKGGSSSYPGKGSVTIKNTAKFWNTIQTAGININGLKLEIWLFQGITPVKYRTYYCEEPNWNSREFTIPFKGTQELRVSNILNTVTSIQFPDASVDTIGKVIPATFGKLYPKYDSFGRMVRKSMAKSIKVDDIENIDVYSNAFFELNSLYPDIKAFPVVEILGPTPIIQIETRGTPRYADGLGIYPVETPANMFVKIVDGTGTGQFREVTGISYTGADNTWNIFIASNWETVPDDETDTATQSWVSFYKIKRNHRIDNFPCKSFLDVDGNEISNAVRVHVGDNNNLDNLPEYAIRNETVSGNNNELNIMPSLLTDDTKSVDGVSIRSITSIYPLVTVDLSAWRHGPEFWELYKYVVDGIYAYAAVPTLSIITLSFLDTQNVTDGAYNTCATFSTSVQSDETFVWAKMIGFTFPSQPELLDWDELYIGVRFKSTTPNGFKYSTSSFRFMFRAWKYKVLDLLEDKSLKESEASCEVADLPDFYYTDDVDNYNNDYYQLQSPDGGGDYTKLSGHSIFKIDGITKENYSAFVEGVLAFTRNNAGIVGSSYDIASLYELSFMFKKSNQDISESLYVPLSGRIFNSTWGGRKTSTNLMTNPADILEHCCRLQDYRDTSPTPPSGWGLQYADSPLIATQGFGSFDSITGRNYEASAQILEFDLGYTDAIKQSLCRNFAIANWQDANGYERAIALPSSVLNPVYTVTLSDILDRTKIKITEPTQNDIYSEPFVRYNINPVSGEYESKISVKNSSASVYNSSYVDGVQNAADAQALWQTCHSLSFKTHQAAKPPSDLTDLIWANGPGGYSIALAHIQRWVSWQSLSEIEFPVHFNTAGSWQECTPINVVLSHQTNNVVKSALVEECIVNPNPPYDTMIKAIMYA
jgi:hypothetical protein